MGCAAQGHDIAWKNRDPLGEKREDLVRSQQIFTGIAGDLANAVESAAKYARSGETVLLSPACASFDQYKSFAKRGEHFRQLIDELVGGSDG